jgi:hypothetical protein
MQPEQRRRLETGGFALSGTPARVARGKVFLARALDPARPEKGSLVAEIDPTYLWGEATALPAMTGLCVVDEQGQRLFCSHESGTAAVTALSETAGASLQDAYRSPSKTRPTSRLSRVVPPPSLRRSWAGTIVASKLETDVFAPIAAFKAIFVPVAGAGIADRGSASPSRRFAERSGLSRS